MIQIPSDIKINFDALLVKKAVLEKLHSHYKKWLRYYLDFCQNKLQDKNQTTEQQKQASHAMSIEIFKSPWFNKRHREE